MIKRAMLTPWLKRFTSFHEGESLMHATTRRSSFLSGISIVSAGAIMLSVSPASADPARHAGVDAVASVVESATGVADVTKPGMGANSTAQAVTDGPEGTVTVTMPPRAGGLVEAKAASGDVLALGFQGASEDVAGATSSSGTVVYENAKGATDLAVQATSDGGVRALVTLKDSSAPTEHRFPLTLQSDVRLVEDESGGYHLVRSSVEGISPVIGTIDAPWAKDASGRSIPTSYRLEGNTLVQTVQTSQNTEFPVVADPKITFGAGVYFNAWGYEWQGYSIAAGSVAYFANVAGCAVLDKIPNVALKRAATAICSAVGYKTLKDWGAFLKNSVKDRSLGPTTCYQTKLMPRNNRLSKVSPGNCK